MLFEILEFVFQIVAPSVSIPVAAFGYFIVAVVWTGIVPIPMLHPLGHVFGVAFAGLCLLAGFKGSQFRRHHTRISRR